MSSGSQRAIEILHSIVETYIETGEPVPSRTVARLRQWDISPATIRNAMADLYDEGYLSQPHTSAGRIPTAKAFESYIASLVPYRTQTAELHRVRAELRRTSTLGERVETSSHLVTEITRNFGIAAAIPTAGRTLRQIELLLLPDSRILMVVVTQDRIVRNRVVGLDEVVPQEELNSIRNYVNHNFSGWTLTEVQEELQRRLAQESAAYDQILKKLTLLYQKGLLELGLEAEVHTEGASNLVGIDLHLTQENLRDLFRALEEKKRILLLLERFLEQPDGEVTVKVGLAEAHPSMAGLALIGVSVTLPSGLSAKIAVLGPMRMNYPKVMSTVLHVGQAFQNFPA